MDVYIQQSVWVENKDGRLPSGTEKEQRGYHLLDIYSDQFGWKIRVVDFLAVQKKNSVDTTYSSRDLQWHVFEIYTTKNSPNHEH